MGTPDYIKIRGARVHNLKNVSLDIPKNKLVVITGLSGSGKSSLAFDTLYAEGQRRYVESLSAYARQFLGVMQKPDADSIEGISPAISIDQRKASHNPRSTVGTMTEIYDYLRLLFARTGRMHCPKCKKPVSRQTIDQITDQILRLPLGGEITILGPVIRGKKGEHQGTLEEIRRGGFVRSRIDGIIYPLEEALTKTLDKNKKHNIEVVVDRLVLSKDLDKSRLVDSLETALKLGKGIVMVNDLIFSEHFACEECEISLPELEPRLFSFNSPFGACPFCQGLGEKLEVDRKLVSANPNLIYKYGQTDIEGVISYLERRYHETDSDYARQEIEQYMVEKVCEECQGKRLRPEALAVWVEGKSISELTEMSIEKVKEFFTEKLSFSKKLSFTKIVQPIIKEIINRLQFLMDVGLNYLTLTRRTDTLAGGEEQRIRLATQIGSKLSGVLYILDEPSVGLHPRDQNRLIETLKRLKDLGNSIIIVEHDPATIKSSDWIIDVGPGAGKRGGKIIFEGTPSQLLRAHTLTGEYLSGRKTVEVRPQNLERSNLSKSHLTIKGAKEHNLKNIDVKIPLGKFVCVTGVSGSGKSSLMNDILARALMKRFYRAKEEPGSHEAILGVENLNKVVLVDQSPIGRTPRSNPATYTGAFTYVRDLFTRTKEARVRGYQVGRFSFNVKGGRCEACEGQGVKKIEMYFLPDVYVECEECQGKRFNKETLSIEYRDKDIAEVLAMTVEEASEFFKNIPGLFQKLKTLNEVGLGYVQIGQPAPSLSGGEAQRVKLADELSKKATGKTLYILDEPTTGLHPDDIKKLLFVLKELANKGNTVLVIEHNLDLIRNADWIIDLGPEGGEKGGHIVAEGTPQDIMKNLPAGRHGKKSYTGQYLKKSGR